MGTVVTKPTLRLDWCSYEAAKYAVEHWHYSRSLPTPPLVKVGVWEDEKYIGCVLFSRGAARNIGSPFGLPNTEIAELTRVALTNHMTPVSRIVRVAIAFLKQSSPGLRLIVSFADPSQNHHGGIYQAGGWAYLGQQAPTVEFIAPDGKQWHGRMVSPTGQKKVYGQYRAVWKPEQCKKVTLPGKHKYAKALDDDMRAKIAHLAKPYPKRPRAESIDADVPAFQVGEDGSLPISALHPSEHQMAEKSPHVTA